MKNNQTYEKLLKGLPTERPADETKATQEELVLGHMRDAFYYAMKCSNGKLTDDDIYDLCYNALCRAAKGFQAGRGIKFMAYSKPFIRGQISRVWLTKDVVRNASLHEEPSLVDEEVQEPSIDPDWERIDLDEKMEMIAPLLAKLSETERTIIDLHYRAGYKFKKIGELLGVTRSATQQTAQRAINKLRALAKESMALSGLV